MKNKKTKKIFNRNKLNNISNYIKLPVKKFLKFSIDKIDKIIEKTLKKIVMKSISFKQHDISKYERYVNFLIELRFIIRRLDKKIPFDSQRKDIRDREDK